MTAPSDLSVPSADPAALWHRRNVWSSTKGAVAHGSSAHHPGGGTACGSEPLTLEQALAAFAAYRADPGTFAIETDAENSVVMTMRRGGQFVSLDLWLDAPYDTAALDAEQVPALIEALYEPISDEEVAARIAALGGELHPHPQSWPWPELLVLCVVAALFAAAWLRR